MPGTYSVTKFLESERDRQGRDLEDARSRIDLLQHEVGVHVGRGRFLAGKIPKREEQARQREERARQEVEQVQGHARFLEREAGALQARLGNPEAGQGWRLFQRLRRWRFALFPRGPRRVGSSPCQ